MTSRGAPYSVSVDDFRLINLRCQYYHNGIKKSYQFFGVNLSLKSIFYDSKLLKLANILWQIMVQFSKAPTMMTPS